MAGAYSANNMAATPCLVVAGEIKRIISQEEVFLEYPSATLSVDPDTGKTATGVWATRYTDEDEREYYAFEGYGLHWTGLGAELLLDAGQEGASEIYS